MKSCWGLFFLILFSSPALGSQPTSDAVATSETESPTLDSLNLRTRPIELLFGSPGIDLDVGVNPSWSLGPSLQYFQNSLTNSRTIYFEAGAQAAYYFSHERFENSWFVRPSLYFLRYDLQSAHPTNLNYFIVSGVLGYEFRLASSGLNSTIGTGLSVFTNSNDTGVEPILEWSVGWAL